MTATIIELPSLRSTPADRAAEAQLAHDTYAEIVYVARLLQPDVDTLDIHRAGCVWRCLRRAWQEAGEPGTFTTFADTALAVVHGEAAA